MRFLLLLLVFFVACANFATAAAAKPVRLFAEAEDFTIKEGWQVLPFRENYFASTFAVSFLSRMGCLSAPEQTPADKPFVAEQAIDVPHAGQFDLLVRFEQPYNFAVEFTVEIEQGGQIVGRFPCGRLADPKIWAFNNHQRAPMVRYGWGGTDNCVWQNPGRVPLAAGAATLRLIAETQMDGAKLRINSGRRNVDVVVLTDDAAGIAAQQKAGYLEFDGWLVQDGDLFVRFTNPTDAPGPCLPIVAPATYGQHSPYYVHVRDWPTTRALKSGRLSDETSYTIDGPRSRAVNPGLLAPVLDPASFAKPKDPNNAAAGTELVVPAGEYLAPGQASGWIPLGAAIDSLHNVQWNPQATYQDAAIKEMYLKLEFAAPDGQGGLKPLKEITVRGKTDDLSFCTFEVPGNVAPNPALAKALAERFWLPQIRTQKEALDWLNVEVAKFPNQGPTAKRFLIYGLLSFSGSLNLFPEARQLAAALGDNVGVGQAGKKRDLVAHWPETDLAAIQKREQDRPGGFDDLYIVSIGDEIHLPAVPLKDDEFAVWLAARGVQSPVPVKWEAQDRNHPLYYYSLLAGVEAGAKPFVAASAYYKSKGVLTGANYSPHSNYLVTEMQYIRPFKMQALTMPWSEDYVWQIPEFSVQVSGYLTSALRAGAKYHQQPIHMYVMPHSPGNTPRDFRLSFYTCVAHGAKMVNYFCATPLAVGYTENYVATDDLDMWRQIHACSHEAGVFEDYVMDGRVRPAKVGLLMSSVDDVMTGATNFSFAMHNNERKAIYYALRHSQTPVDFLSEDDVIEGLAADYRVIYVTEQWLHTKAVAALQKWVEAGGTLVALCGGGFLDEFNRPSPLAGELYGVKSQQITTDPHLIDRYLLTPNSAFFSKQDLPLYEPIDAASWTHDDPLPAGVADGRGAKAIRDVPVICWKQNLEPSDAVVLGTFRDGQPAVLAKTHGKGRAYLFGFLPGQAYLKSGLPILPPDRGSTDAAFTHYLPTTMDVNLCLRLVDDFLPGRIAETGEQPPFQREIRRWVTELRPVECSVPLVETTCIDTPPLAGQPARLAVPLMNFTGRRIDRLTVLIHDVPKAASVRSVERGTLTPVFEGSTLMVDLPLETADMLLIDRN